MHKDQIEEIKKLVDEKIELEYYGSRNATSQFLVQTVSGNSVPGDYLMLISLDKTAPELNRERQYFGELEIFLCKKKTGLFGREKVEVIKSYQKVYTKRQRDIDVEKVRLKNIFMM